MGSREKLNDEHDEVNEDDVVHDYDEDDSNDDDGEDFGNDDESADDVGCSFPPEKQHKAKGYAPPFESQA